MPDYDAGEHRRRRGLTATADVKAAIDAAAEADGRSVTSYLERVVVDHLRTGGFLLTK